MAGEIDESYSFSFQADSLHSGSISFGRFENEPLSWERRSSFSHNKYLEEVEKCSKPGSVIEKKAYFEAHFRKKGLLCPNSSDCHNDGEYQTGEKDVLESREQFEHVNEGSHYALFDESPNGSEYHGEYEVTGCEMKNPGFSFSVPQMESALNNADVLVDYVNAEETRQVEIDCDKFLSVNDGPEITIDHSPNGDAVKADKSYKSIANFEPGIEENQNFDCDTVNAEKSSKGTDPSPKTGPAVTVDITSLEHSPNPSPKLRAATETKPSKPRVKSQANVVRVKRDISGASSKDPPKKPSRKERENSLGNNLEKNSARVDVQTTHAVHRTPILEDSRSRKAKLIHDNKSGEKESRRKKVGESQSSSTKTEPSGHQRGNRLDHTVNSTKADAKLGAAVFSFKSDERAERRKEFYMKLEKKMHAKEAEINQIQAKTQEKTEAEIKQFRRSLNFKAMPMPSFYHVAVSPGSDGKKAVLSNNKCNKAQTKSTSPGSRAAAGSKSCSKAGNDQALYTSESVNTTEPLDASNETNCPTAEHSEGSAISQTPSTNRSYFPEATAGNEVVGRKEREKEKDTGLHKGCVSESHKVTKGQRIEGKQRVGAQTSSNELARKDMKHVGIGSRSRMGNLAVGVAS
ncbi:protein WVD2-like 7 isoform X2 [Corylus avellana]|uniref:protein WVD2-like 7 isoform X2 n=1 Tax=Corylus avellana TaxID=13451 RepID=UPI00286CD5B1|nr:protein WVD2-like 7 isoform X2 [Corylus avellana]